MLNKKAQGLSINTIILVILGVVVLVVLILGFTMGWRGIKDLFGSSDNIETIVTQCSIACASNQKHTYCYDKRVLKVNDEEKEDVTCYTLTKSLEYGIGTCPSISCGILDDEDKGEEFCGETQNTGLQSNFVNAGKKVYYIGEDYKLIESKCNNDGTLLIP